MLQESCREMSPAGPSHFTESEANGVLEKLKGTHQSSLRHKYCSDLSELTRYSP